VCLSLVIQADSNQVELRFCDTFGSPYQFSQAGMTSCLVHSSVQRDGDFDGGQSISVQTRSGVLVRAEGATGVGRSAEGAPAWSRGRGDGHHVDLDKGPAADGGHCRRGDVDKGSSWSGGCFGRGDLDGATPSDLHGCDLKLAGIQRKPARRG
jgi:hypothetical protein